MEQIDIYFKYKNEKLEKVIPIEVFFSQKEHQYAKLLVYLDANFFKEIPEKCIVGKMFQGIAIQQYTQNKIKKILFLGCGENQILRGKKNNSFEIKEFWKKDVDLDSFTKYYKSIGNTLQTLKFCNPYSGEIFDDDIYPKKIIEIPEIIAIKTHLKKIPHERIILESINGLEYNQTELYSENISELIKNNFPNRKIISQNPILFQLNWVAFFSKLENDEKITILENKLINLGQNEFDCNVVLGFNTLNTTLFNSQLIINNYKGIGERYYRIHCSNTESLIQYAKNYIRYVNRNLEINISIPLNINIFPNCCTKIDKKKGKIVSVKHNFKTRKTYLKILTHSSIGEEKISIQKLPEKNRNISIVNSFSFKKERPIMKMNKNSIRNNKEFRFLLKYSAGEINE